MWGVLFIGLFFAVVLAYVCTEYLLIRMDARRRVLIGRGNSIVVVLAANVISFTILWMSSLVFVAASGADYYMHATIVCVFAQAVWLSQHLWLYYRDHPRLHYE